MCTSALFAWLLSILVLCSEARKDHPKKTKEIRIPLDHQKSIREGKRGFTVNDQVTIHE